MKKALLLIVGICGIAGILPAQPQPGDVFREYVWLPEMVQSEGGKFLRVGGKLDYKSMLNISRKTGKTRDISRFTSMWTWMAL